MFILFGFGRQTDQEYTMAQKETCVTCKEASYFKIIRRRTWFTLFFIPVIPYKTEYFAVCPHCNTAFNTSKEDFNSFCSH